MTSEARRSTVKLIAESPAGRVVEIDAPGGSALVDLFDEHQAPVPFNCRSASCGMCRVHVLEGADDLSPPAEDELDLLAVFDQAPPLVRLACQARLRERAARVRVQAIEDE
jgi:2Fe-2S ferredoxin